MSEDPMGFSSGTINFYNYVSNNPINFIDPLGLFGCDNTCLANCFKEAGRQLTRCRLFESKRNSARAVLGGGAKACTALTAPPAIGICLGTFAVALGITEYLFDDICKQEYEKDLDRCFDKCCGENECKLTEDGPPVETRCCSLGRGA